MNFLQNSFSFLRVVYAEHIFLFTKLHRGENQKVFLYITVTNIKGDFFAIFNFKKNIVYRREPKTKKNWREKYLRVFLETHFPIFFQIQIVCMCMYLLHAA